MSLSLLCKRLLRVRPRASGPFKAPRIPRHGTTAYIIYNLSRLANSGEASVVSSRLMHSLRLSFSGTSTGLGRLGAATPGLLAAARGGRSVSAAPVQDMEPPRDDMHKTTEDVMTHSFGVAYSTRSDEEGFGGVYARDDDRPTFNRRTAEAHPSHPGPDHGSAQVKEEKASHLKDDEKHAT